MNDNITTELQNEAVTPRFCKGAVMRSAFSCPPYELSKEEFNYFMELYHPDCASQGRVTKGCDKKMKLHAEMMQWLSYGVTKWLYGKAFAGDSDALFKLEHSYNLYEEVINKAKEEGKL